MWNILLKSVVTVLVIYAIIDITKQIVNSMFVVYFFTGHQYKKYLGQ